MWEKRFQSVLGREQFYVAYKTHYSLHRWRNCKMIWLKGGNGASFNNNSSQFISPKLGTQQRKLPLLHSQGAIFSCCRSHLCILTSSLVHKSLLLLFTASFSLLQLVKLVLQCCSRFFIRNMKAFIPEIVLFLRKKYHQFINKIWL